MKWKVEQITDESSNILLETATETEGVIGMGFPIQLAKQLVHLHNLTCEALIREVGYYRIERDELKLKLETQTHNLNIFNRRWITLEQERDDYRVALESIEIGAGVESFDFDNDYDRLTSYYLRLENKMKCAKEALAKYADKSPAKE